MPHEHRVAGHLGVEADAYDRTIRTFIPQYDRMLSTIVHWLDASVPAGRRTQQVHHQRDEHVHRVLDPLQARAAFHFGTAEWRRKGLGAWCHTCRPVECAEDQSR